MLGFPLEKFKSRIALIVLNFALWSVQKTHAILSINQMQNKKNYDWSPAFSRALGSLLVFNLTSPFPIKM